MYKITHLYTSLCTLKCSVVARLHVYTCTYIEYIFILLLLYKTYKYKIQ